MVRPSSTTGMGMDHGEVTVGDCLRLRNAGMIAPIRMTKKGERNDRLKMDIGFSRGRFFVVHRRNEIWRRAHIFPYIEYKAAAGGIPIAEHAFPVGNLATGALEILTGLLVIIPPIRQLGAKLAVLPFLGAVVFHLTPLLGVVTPTRFADPKPVEALAAGGPFDASHFATTESNALFMMAAGGLIAAIINLIVQRNV